MKEATFSLDVTAAGDRQDWSSGQFMKGQQHGFTSFGVLTDRAWTLAQGGFSTILSGDHQRAGVQHANNQEAALLSGCRTHLPANPASVCSRRGHETVLPGFTR